MSVCIPICMCVCVCVCIRILNVFIRHFSGREVNIQQLYMHK